ncbi:MAG TPA: hypothetical protein VJM34_05170 [Novosphingobium sp.]|nr:hypothetical protein [Novosphingobium sp.]
MQLGASIYPADLTVWAWCSADLPAFCIGSGYPFGQRPPWQPLLVDIAGEPACDLLCSELADVLDDHDQPHRATASPNIALTKDEIDLIDRIVINRTGQPPPRELSSYLTQIARFGGYLARERDPPPGNIVIWRGWSRLMDMVRAGQPSC